MNKTKGAEYDPTASPYRTQADWGMISLPDAEAKAHMVSTQTI